MDEVTYEVWQEEMCVATVYGSHDAAKTEANHYAIQYAQDGEPATVYRVTREKVAEYRVGEGVA